MVEAGHITAIAHRHNWFRLEMGETAFDVIWAAGPGSALGVGTL